MSSRCTGQHLFGGSNRVLPEWRTQIVYHANELLQSVFFDGRRVWMSPLLPNPKYISCRWILVLFGDKVSQTNVLSFDRINDISARILGGKLPPDPVPYAYDQ